MKKLFFVFLIFCSSFNLSGQVGSIFDEIGGWFSGIEWFRENFSLDVTHNSFIGETNDVKQKWNSIGYNFGIMLNKDLLYKNGSRFTIGYGVRFANNTFRNDGVLHIYDSLNLTKFEVYSSDTARSAYKISMRYFEVPLEFRWRYYGGRFDVLRFSFGCVLGFRSKFFDESKFADITLARSNFGDVNSFRFGLIARVGFRHLGLYAGYYFTPVFQNQSSSKLNVLSIGINFAI